MRNGLRFSLLCLLAVLVPFGPPFQVGAQACPFCDAPTTTLSEQLGTSHAAILAKWVSAERPDPNTFTEGTTVFETLDAAGTGAGEFPKGTRFTAPRYHSGEPGDESLFFVSKEEDKLVWGLPSLCSRECWQYIVTAPERSKSATERLPFFMAHLEHPDPDIAMDAFGEFARVDYEVVKAVSGKFSRTQILGWLNDPLTVPTRKGLYGMMLGLCGNLDDAEAMARIIRQQPEDSRMGIDGMIAGYMLLAGNAATENLIQWKIQDSTTPDHELFSLIKALEFMWLYGRDRVDGPQLKKTLRLILDRAQLCDIIVLDLARWQDWEVMDRLAEQYGKEQFADRQPRQAIIRFLMVAEQDAGPEYSQRARDYLKQIRKQDPKTVAYVEKHTFD